MHANEAFEDGIRANAVRLQLLATLTTELAATDSMPEVVEIVVNQVAEVVGASVSALLLREGDDLLIIDNNGLRFEAATSSRTPKHCGLSPPSKLDVNQYAFDTVITTLADVGFVSGIQQSNGLITQFTENVPLYTNLYQSLGQAWRSKEPSDLEQQMIPVVDRLATAPIPQEELADRASVDTADLQTILDVWQEE